ncbi:MAG TPA: class IV adenylate cyclase [Candidatus Moranbacteria bacterium]|nr:class IV adenylate cyclase [Candidatus Moranbacteria bacterium]
MNKVEIEKKYLIKGKNTAKIIKKLTCLGASHVEDIKQTDVYFNTPKRSSLSSKECLRIRTINNKIFEITYKPPTAENHQSSNFFAKQEINLSVDSAKMAEVVLLSIGCKIITKVEKNRKCFRLDKFEIFLDNVKGAGMFLEVETIDYPKNTFTRLMEIETIVASLGINSADVESKPYRDLVMEEK